MKKIGILFLFLLFLIFRPQESFAQMLTISPEPTSSPPAKIEYFLPYPGILPGSPLYPLKALRDRITEFLISDPEKKGEFYILQADKRLSASVLLQEQGKEELSETTVSKAEKYLEKALGQAVEIKNRGQNNDPLLEKIELSSQKHKEVIEGLILKTEKRTAKKLSLSLELTEKISDQAKKLRAPR